MTITRWALRALIALLLFNLSPLDAQCSNVWFSSGPLPGTDDVVRAAAMWDPDGTGPTPAKLVLGGVFSTVLNAAAERVALFDPQTGVATPLGAGITGQGFGAKEVGAIATMPNGDLIVGGMFSSAGGVPANSIARWNGSMWSPLGSGLTTIIGPGTVNAMAVLPNGDLVVGGGFAFAGGMVANHIARWNGSTWSALGPGANNGVSCLAVLANGDLVAGGYFSSIGGVAASLVGQWNGTSWSALGAGLSGPQLPPPAPPLAALTMTVTAIGDLIVGGRFDTAGGTAANNIARWNGTAWSSLGSGTSGRVLSLLALGNGDVVAGGYFVSPAVGIARWNGVTWTPLAGGLNNEVLALAALPNGDIAAGGWFSATGAAAFAYLGRWNGSAWQPLVPGGGLSSSVEALAALPNGDLVVGGYFSSAGGVVANHVVRRSGTTWWPLGTGTDGAVTALVATNNGDVVAGGSFLSAGGVSANRIARWNGSTWSALGTGINGGVLALAVLPNGDIVAGGYFGTAGGAPANAIARWNGTSWSPLGSGLTNGFGPGSVNALAVLPNGDLVAAGVFLYAGGTSASMIARWNGTSWSALGAGMNFEVRALAVLPNGDLLAGGDFSERVARWNGTSWSPEISSMGGWGLVCALAALPNGDYVAAGDFTYVNSITTSRVARKRGAAWEALGLGVNSTARAMAVLTNGDVAIGGSFSQANGVASSFLAVLSTTCPATAASSGLGCPSSGGNNVLAALTLPWVGATFRARGTGLPVTALVPTLTSLTPVLQGAFPLSSVFAQAGPGCDVLTAPDILGLVVSTTGVAESSLFLPNTPPLIGASFYHQMIPIELDSQGAIVAVTATNALRLVAGAF